MKKYLSKLIPRFLKTRIQHYINCRIIYNFNPEKVQFCPVCNNNIYGFKRFPDNYLEMFDKYGYIHSVFLSETLNMLEYSCSNCGTTDRDRLYALFIKKTFAENHRKIKLVDFAPSKKLSELIRSFTNVEYRSADLHMENVDDQVDVTNMFIYKDEQFDVFICSHILEHVYDDIKAIRELYRILKKDGWGILMAPINLGLKEVYENPEIKSPEDRWKHFGQHDHVRVYSKQGFLKRIKSVGFKVKEYDVNYFGKTVFAKCGINQRSVLYIVTK